MDDAGTGSGTEEPPTKKRARGSRAGKPLKFVCSHEGCGKRYSRSEHLKRHELNHNPKQVFHCEVPGCGQSFVRTDLFARHKAKHTEGETGHFETNDGTIQTQQEPATSSAELQSYQYEANPEPTSAVNLPPLHHTDGGSHGQPGVAPLATPTSHYASEMQPGYSVPPAQESVMDPSTINSAMLPSQSMSTPWLPLDQADGMGPTDNFASWLFESPKSQPNYDFDLTNLPYIDFGVDFSPGTATDTALRSSVADMGFPATGDSWTPTTLDWSLDAHSSISETRRQEIVQLMQIFIRKSKRSRQPDYILEGILFQNEAGELPNLTTSVLENTVQSFWTKIAAQVAVLHQWTFSCNKCHPMLLLAIVALGASALVQGNPKGTSPDHRTLADLITTHLRWEIFTEDDSEPPVQLWVAQALLLVEFHEKMYSTRRLHERAVIHHASTLTLLRRGSPLIGRAGSESPPRDSTACPSPNGMGASNWPPRSNGYSWWRRWAKNESMHRVVFTAFQMDVLHAVMFGHEHQLAPFEIRLNLPCDDSLWNAKTVEDFQHLSSSFAMYSISETPSFLEALKQCMHGHEVQTHQNARLVLFSGLLSVGWHINRREKHLQFLDTVPTGREQARWRAILFNAFSSWKQSFEIALSRSKHSASTQQAGNDQPIVLYHLCHITMHVDLIDLQMLAGSKRLLSRKVSSKDRNGVLQRMRAWAMSAAARHAVLHSFKLLYHSIAKRLASETSSISNGAAYSCRSDPLIYRPWVLYLAALTIWAHEMTLRVEALNQQSSYSYEPPSRPTQYTACRYINSSAELEDADNVILMINHHGCMAVLELLSEEFANAESELLLEASARLMQCKRMLAEGSWDVA